MIDAPDVETYRAAREEILAMVADLPAERSGLDAPTCPGWSVHDVVSHLTGIAVDVSAGRVDGAGSPEWTARQVDARRDVPVADICREWRDAAVGFDAILAGAPDLAARAAADAVVHAVDLAVALDRPVDAARLPVATAASRYSHLFAARVEAAGLGAALVLDEDGTALVGADDPKVVVQGPALDLLLAFSGRLTEEQVRALRWQGEPADVAALISPYGTLPAEPVVT
jgi:uncharacterized protein (TIGR03083 family)